MIERVHRRLPDVELSPELIGHRLDTIPDLPCSAFPLRHVEGLEVAAIGVQLAMAVEDVEREQARSIDVLNWGVA